MNVPNKGGHKMRWLYSILILFLLMFCSEKPLSPLRDTVINVTNFGGFELELNTWSPDDIRGWSTRGGQLVVYCETGKYSQNKSHKSFEVNQSAHRGLILFQYVSDSLVILGLGKGVIFDGFNKPKETVYPGESYRHISRIDSVKILNVGEAIYYSNYWYMREFDPDKIFNKEIGKSLGKILVGSE